MTGRWLPSPLCASLKHDFCLMFWCRYDTALFQHCSRRYKRQRTTSEMNLTTGFFTLSLPAVCSNSKRCKNVTFNVCKHWLWNISTAHQHPLEWAVITMIPRFSNSILNWAKNKNTIVESTSLPSRVNKRNTDCALLRTATEPCVQFKMLILFASHF